MDEVDSGLGHWCIYFGGELAAACDVPARSVPTVASCYNDLTETSAPILDDIGNLWGSLIYILIFTFIAGRHREYYDLIALFLSVLHTHFPYAVVLLLAITVTTTHFIIL